MRNTSWGVAFLALAASGCAGTDQQAQRATPPNIYDYGVFAYDDGRLTRLASESEFTGTPGTPWGQRPDYHSDVRLVVNDPSLPMSTEVDRIELWRMMSVTNAEYSTPQPSGGIPPWINTQAQRVPVSFNTYPTTEIIEVVPRQPLTPGLYAFLYDGDERTTIARFGVDWKNAEAVAFNSDTCVDRVESGIVSSVPCPVDVAAAPAAEITTAAASGSAVGEGTAAALAPTPFSLHLDEPVRQNVGGEELLVVSGVVANMSQSTTVIPAVRLSLKDSGGAVLQSWDVPTPQGQLEPGQTVQFSQSLRDLPPGAATVAATVSQ